MAGIPASERISAAVVATPRISPCVMVHSISVGHGTAVKRKRAGKAKCRIQRVPPPAAVTAMNSATHRDVVNQLSNRQSGFG